MKGTNKRQIVNVQYDSIHDLAAGITSNSKTKNIRKCRECGCTDSHACHGGCFWVGLDLCSACYSLLKEKHMEDPSQEKPSIAKELIKLLSTHGINARERSIEILQNLHEYEVDNMSNYEYKYFKLVKVSNTGEKIGYYNSDLDPEDSWPTQDVDSAQILTKEQVKSVMTIVNLQKKHFNLQFQVQEVGVY